MEKERMEKEPFFEMRNITKYFSRVIANKNVNLTIQRGEVLALLGENGAGKSTIMKILFGLYKADEGQILKDGIEQKIQSPKDAMALGISMIQQHFSLIPAHTVTENIILGSASGIIDYKVRTTAIEELIKKYNFGIDPNQKISELDVGEQQKVEILKALFLNANLLIMDEPTAVLTPQETDRLMVFIRDYTKQGNSVIFITHKMKEVMEVADRIVVMRDGSVNGNIFKNQTDESELSRLMIGRQLSALEVRNTQTGAAKDQALAVANLTYHDIAGILVLNDISFTIGQGEILGIAGVSGNGQEELCEVICGAIVPEKGILSLNDTDITQCSIKERIELGIGYVPVDRYKDAMVPDMSVAENIMLRTSYDPKWTQNLFINVPYLTKESQSLIEQFDVKTPGVDEKIGRLSGGNQQKVIVGREVRIGRELLIINQPTRGLDLGAVYNIHSTILEQKRLGKAILLVSTELSEIFSLSDRIAVMFKGRFMGIYRPEELDTEKIGLLMAGYQIKEGVQ